MNAQIVLRLIDRTTAPLRHVISSMASLSAASAKWAASMAKWPALAASGGLISTAYMAVDAFTEQDAAVKALQATMMRKGGIIPATFKEISDIAGQLGNELPGTTDDFYNLAKVMLSQNVTDKSLLGGALKAAAHLGVVLRDNGVAMSEAGEAMAKFKSGLSIDDRDLVGFADTVQRIVKAGVGLNELRYSIAGIASQLPKLGWTGLESARNTATLAGMLLKDGNMSSGETVGSGLKNLFMQVSSKGNIKRLNRALSGIKGADGQRIQKLNFYDQQGRFIDQAGLVRELNKLNKLNLSQFNSITKKYFGEEGGNVARLLAQLGPEVYEKNKAALDEQGSLTERINLLMQSLAAQWEAATGIFRKLMATVGGLFEPELRACVKALDAFSEEAIKFLEQHRPEIRRKINDLIDAMKLGAAGFGPMIESLVSKLSDFGKSILGVISHIGNLSRAYDAMPEEEKGKLKSTNPFTFLEGLFKLDSEMKAQAIYRQIDAENAAYAEKVKTAVAESWMGAGKQNALVKTESWPGFGFGSFPVIQAGSLEKAMKAGAAQQQMRRDKLVVEITGDGVPRLKSFTQGPGPWRDVELIPYTGKALTY